MSQIFREETGCFSFCPLTSVSFPSLHPLFPCQKPFPPQQHTFIFPPIPLPHPPSARHRHHDLTSHLTPTQFSRFQILFLVFGLSFPISERFLFSLFPFLYMQSWPVIIRVLTHSAVYLWKEDAFSVAPRRAASPSLTLRV